MIELEKIKKEIQIIFSAPPPLKEMLQDLKMNNLELRQKHGDIELLNQINRHLIYKTWKVLKVTNLMEKHKRLFNQNQSFYNAVQKQLEQELDIWDKGIPHHLEGYFKEGRLELEIFKKKKIIKN